MSPVWFLFFSCLKLLILSAGNAKGNQDYCSYFFDCGSLGTVGFPFTTIERQNCGLLAIHGCNDPNQTAVKRVRLKNGGKVFHVTHVNSHWHPSISIIDEDFNKLLQNASCNAFGYNISVPPSSPFGYFNVQNSINTFNCSHKHKHKLNHTNDFVNYTRCHSFDFYFAPPSSNQESLRSLTSSCSMVQLPKRQDSEFFKDPFAFLTSEITLVFTFSDECVQCFRKKGGFCRPDSKGNFFCDTTRKGPWMSNSAQGSRVWSWKLALIPAVTVALLLIMVMIYYTRWKKQNPTNQRIDVFFKRHGALQTKRYGYSEIKKVTNSFRNKLGQGGFGIVYKGKLLDGRYVAVKILKDLKDNGDEFINEVASISRTSHINIVTLLGFCYEGCKRALVYEFMSNGSLEKFISEENALMRTDRQLNCQTLYNIAIGVGRGLEYLHKGCNTRILHFDIKPHNILLDENFNPKISDFGLAKICTRKESTVSIFGARGTAGYIAPEVFSRNFGAVSHKSDVYSYGMMVLEMIGGRKNIKTEVDLSSEVYFPDWIYNRLESNQELGLHNIRNENDDKLVRKMTIVGLWCIQTRPSTRPAISKVVEMLEGNVELLEIPPKPFFSSPATSPVNLSSGTL